MHPSNPLSNPASKSRIARVSGARIWVIPQVQGDAPQLAEALETMMAHRQSGDSHMFLGSQIGQGGGSIQVMEQILAFSKAMDGQTLWLKGIQEELLERLLTLHLAPDPAAVLAWMDQEHGMAELLASLGADMAPIASATQQGLAPLAQTLAQLRTHVHALPAFSPYMAACERAAVTENGAVLFVHGGVDPARPLSLQTDAFWWGHPDFFRMKQPFADFKMIYSTLVPKGQREAKGPGRYAFDGGAGRDGLLQITCISELGDQIN